MDKYYILILNELFLKLTCASKYKTKNGTRDLCSFTYLFNDFVLLLLKNKILLKPVLTRCRTPSSATIHTCPSKVEKSNIIGSNWPKY